eukprot:4632594-Pleurochrysis_carterae.AAC.2
MRWRAVSRRASARTRRSALKRRQAPACRRGRARTRIVTSSALGEEKQGELGRTRRKASVVACQARRARCAHPVPAWAACTRLSACEAGARRVSMPLRVVYFVARVPAASGHVHATTTRAPAQRVACHRGPRTSRCRAPKGRPQSRSRCRRAPADTHAPPARARVYKRSVREEKGGGARQGCAFDAL